MTFPNLRVFWSSSQGVVRGKVTLNIAVILSILSTLSEIFNFGALPLNKKLFPAIFITSSQVAVKGEATPKITVAYYSGLIQSLEIISCDFNFDVLLLNKKNLHASSQVAAEVKPLLKSLLLVILEWSLVKWRS